MIEEFRGKYRFLSNFYLSPVKFRGDTFQSVEHAYQAGKTDNLKDYRRIWAAETPGMAKKLGRVVDIRGDWEFIKLALMHYLVKDKFTRNIELRKRLMDTGDERLIEGNDWGDKYWGMTRDAAGDLRGENQLGNILMNVRERLRSLL